MNTSRMRRGAVGAFACLGAPVAVAALAYTPAVAASAPHTGPSIHSAKACWVSTSKLATMHFTGFGFTPGDQVVVSDKGDNFYGYATVASNGTVDVSLSSPFYDPLKPGAKKFTGTAVEETSEGAAAGVSIPVSFSATTLNAAPSPSSAAPNKTVTWRFSGFTPGKHIFSHFLYKGKVAATANYGKASGPCGTLTTHQKLYPGGHPKHVDSNYKVQIDNSKKYSKKSKPALQFTFEVF